MPPVLMTESTDAGRRMHLLSAADVTRAEVESWMHRADTLRQMSRADCRKILADAVVAALFYEPSTRTRLSFETAVQRLGGRVVTAENALENSSAKKGERLEDVFRVVGCYADAIVIRHHESNTMAEAAPHSPVPVINAGAGAGEHPTQALLDVYTIRRELGRVDHLNVCVMGDLRYGRTVHSLLTLLAQFRGITVTLLHPESLGLPDTLRATLAARGLALRCGVSVETALAEADVVYQTRIQTERLASQQEAAGVERFRLTPDRVARLKPTARILHPLPRVDEIAMEVDADPRAAYFRQVENGLYLRMAVLESLVRG
ncbi:aspartate carbamoyltransferase [Alicyclobacillus contaminans]|uniref:aspartate carbamoyltransferase n=1 Tax=Alicyclobacillus contaminans TaxID=392016 RepID=UPI0003F89DE0|nr:aspartate carbamoyltransferase [Alicyclobacillus contaminans]GMA49137.1 aspartate carbamoyltransferase [Alicyclobacillus contaminans]